MQHHSAGTVLPHGAEVGDFGNRNGNGVANDGNKEKRNAVKQQIACGGFQQEHHGHEEENSNAGNENRIFIAVSSGKPCIHSVCSNDNKIGDDHQYGCRPAVQVSCIIANCNGHIDDSGVKTADQIGDDQRGEGFVGQKMKFLGFCGGGTGNRLVFFIRM